MKSRHRAREITLQILYQYDLSASTRPQGPPSAHELIQSLRHHFEHFAVPDSLREFVGQLVTGTLSKTAELDSLLEAHASNWKVARMSSVDRCLLRMAAYEMVFFKETPPSIVIDEAIELAKQFGTSETPAFINGVLDSIKNKQVREVGSE